MPMNFTTGGPFQVPGYGGGQPGGYQGPPQFPQPQGDPALALYNYAQQNMPPWAQNQGLDAMQYATYLKNNPQSPGAQMFAQQQGGGMGFQPGGGLQAPGGRTMAGQPPPYSGGPLPPDMIYYASGDVPYGNDMIAQPMPQGPRPFPVGQPQPAPAQPTGQWRGPNKGMPLAPRPFAGRPPATPPGPSLQPGGKPLGPQITPAPPAPTPAGQPWRQSRPFRGDMSLG